MIKLQFTLWSHRYYCLEHNRELLVDGLFQDSSFFFPMEMTRIAADGDEECVFEKDEELLKEKYFLDELKSPVVSQYVLDDMLEDTPEKLKIQSENVHFKSRTRRRGLLEIISGRSSQHPNPSRLTHTQRVKDEDDFENYVQDCVALFADIKGSIGLLSKDGDALVEDGNTVTGVPRFQRVTLLCQTYVELFGRDRLLSVPGSSVSEAEGDVLVIRFDGGFDEAVTDEWVDEVNRHLDGEKKLFRVNLAGAGQPTVDYLDLSEFVM